MELFIQIYSNSNPDLKVWNYLFKFIWYFFCLLTKCPQNKDIPESQPILIRNTKLQLNDLTPIMINKDPVTAFS